jgi:hypothetical protein
MVVIADDGGDPSDVDEVAGDQGQAESPQKDADTSVDAE